MDSIGKARRLNRILRASDHHSVIVPLDDTLLSGPENGLTNPTQKLNQAIQGRPDAIIGFKGLFVRNYESMLDVGCIMNLTASTTRKSYTRKIIVTSVEEALKLDMDAVAVHVNISSRYESEMLKTLGHISRECDNNGMPLIAFMYPRTEKKSGTHDYYDLLESDPDAYTAMVKHAARVGVDLGADMIKTQFTGSEDTFHSVVQSCGEVPIVIAGGPLKNANQIFSNAFYAIQAGAAGVSYGRNIFNRANSHQFIEALIGIVHNQWSIDEAIQHVDTKQVEEEIL